MTRDTLETPLGPMLAMAGPNGLSLLEWTDDANRAEQAIARLARHGAVDGEGDLGPIRAWLAAYYAGRFDALPEVALDPRGTDFELQVWAELRRVRLGHTTTYGELARTLGKPASAARAIGAAVGQNPLAVVVPCHRVIGKDGGLVGFAGGLERKAWLLRHEGALLL